MMKKNKKRKFGMIVITAISTALIFLFILSADILIAGNTGEKRLSSEAFSRINMQGLDPGDHRFTSEETAVSSLSFLPAKT